VEPDLLFSLKFFERSKKPRLQHHTLSSPATIRILYRTHPAQFNRPAGASQRSSALAARWPTCLQNRFFKKMMIE
jgi:hypothetical protein